MEYGKEGVLRNSSSCLKSIFFCPLPPKGGSDPGCIKVPFRGSDSYRNRGKTKKVLLENACGNFPETISETSN
jgi:hypothetical protein